MKHRLINDIETALGYRLQTPKDFEYLRNKIYSRQQIIISTTTLKRIWGYLNDSVETRESTLGILAQFLGYHGWDEYCEQSMQPSEQQSSPIMSRRLNVATELNRDDKIRLIWLPDRVCVIKYLGDLTFRVCASQNTRIKKGNTFQCSVIIDGEPLYIDNLRQGEQPPVAYICGKKSGVKYELIPKYKYSTQDVN